MSKFGFKCGEIDYSEDLWPNKLFIGGISPFTTADVLKYHFSRYGKVVDCVVMQKNGRPRGFGFVTFQESDAADEVMLEPQMLDGRIVDVKRAVPEQYQSLVHGFSMEAKLFVGGLSQNVTSESLAKYFSKFGQVADAVVMRDKATTRSRGFGFVRFDTNGGQGAMDQVFQCLDHRLEGKWIDVKKATPPGLSPPPKDARPGGYYLPGGLITDGDGDEDCYTMENTVDDVNFEESRSFGNEDSDSPDSIHKQHSLSRTTASGWEDGDKGDSDEGVMTPSSQSVELAPSITPRKSSFSREDFLALESYYPLLEAAPQIEAA